jgi:hypothetical protein
MTEAEIDNISVVASPYFWTFHHHFTTFFKNSFSKIVVPILRCKPITPARIHSIRAMD